MTTVYNEDQLRIILAKLSAPFALSDIRWRVIERSRDKKSGKMHAYADPRVYDMRLNDVLTPAGWSCSYVTGFTAGLTRINGKGVTIPTGKITVNATVTIHGISTRDATGEGWADDNNAMCVAEAQAFKRACSKFGVGRYFYTLGLFYQQAAEARSKDFNPWVPLDSYGHPTRLPNLPDWAIPATVGNASLPTAAAARNTSTSTPRSVAPVAAKASKAVDHLRLFNQKKESYRQALGDALYRDVVSRIQALHKPNASDEEKYTLSITKLDQTVALLEKVITGMVDLSEPEFRYVMDPLTLVNMRAFPSVDELIRVSLKLPAPARRAA